MTLVHVTIFVLCALIYLRIRAIHRELVRYDQLANVHCERRAFGTIALMLATLGLFFAPYMTLHVISLNLPAASEYLHASAVVYYMNLPSRGGRETDTLDAARLSWHVPPADALATQSPCLHWGNTGQ